MTDEVVPEPATEEDDPRLEPAAPNPQESSATPESTWPWSPGDLAASSPDAPPPELQGGSPEEARPVEPNGHWEASVPPAAAGEDAVVLDLGSPEDAEPEFDFECHRRGAIDAYQRVQSQYQDCARAVYAVLGTALEARGVSVHSIESRAKKVSSFAAKASRPSADDPSAPKYADPLEEITDLSGVRVITFLPQASRQVCEVVEREFTVLEKSDPSFAPRPEANLGYPSVYYLVRFSAPRSALPEYARFAGMTTEVQVRTILQHAWGEIERDIQYKAVEAIPAAIRSRLTSLAGLLEIADREFQAIADDDRKVRTDARRLIELGHLDRVEITPDALAVYLDGRFGPDGRMSEWSYSWTTRLLKRLGFQNLAELDECLAPYDDDKVSRAVWGIRRGQLSRLEDVLLASMGEAFVNGHRYHATDWWAPAAKARLERLRAQGVRIGSYRPGGSVSAIAPTLPLS